MAYDIFGNPVTKPTKEEEEADSRLRSFLIGVVIGFGMCLAVVLG